MSLKLFLFYFFVSIFSPPLPLTPPIPASHPRTYALWLCPCVLYSMYTGYIEKSIYNVTYVTYAQVIDYKNKMNTCELTT